MNQSKSREQLTDKTAISFIILLSVIICAFLIWWIYFKATPTDVASWVFQLPTLNASLNFLTSLFLVAGFVSIKRGYKVIHRNLMLLATLTSAFFLISYLTYHHFHGDTLFQGVGAIRYLYFSILVSHILLSIIQIPCILTTLYFAFCGNFEKHKKIARWTFPIWLYVSLTGVLIFFFLNY